MSHASFLPLTYTFHKPEGQVFFQKFFDQTRRQNLGGELKSPLILSLSRNSQFSLVFLMPLSSSFVYIYKFLPIR